MNSFELLHKSTQMRQDKVFQFQIFFVSFSIPSCRSYKTATDEQLYEILERERRKINPSANYPPIPDIFRSWANNPGFPILNVEFFESNFSLKVSQELFESQLGINSSSNFLIVYSYLPVSDNNFLDRYERTNWLQTDELQKHHTIPFQTEFSPNWILMNVRQSGMSQTFLD